MLENHRLIRDNFKKFSTPAIEALLGSIRTAGGRPLLVGGWVRDALTGQASKDIDIEVFGLEVSPLKRALAEQGRVFAVGVSFGVLKVYLPDNTELDVSVPRRESRSGKRGWIIEPDPTMTLQEAAARRDFTINALAYDSAADELLDFFNGQSDLAMGILRHVGPAFAEDPLRVLRGMQFAARWDFRFAPETVEMCAGLRPAYPTLAQARIWSEWQKLAEKGLRPSAGLVVLEQTGWRSLYPALERLASFSLDPADSLGRTAWNQTLQAADSAVRICQRDGLNGESKTILILAAICHSLGRALAEGSYDGEIAAAEAGNFLKSIGSTNQIRRQVVKMVKEQHVTHESELSPRAVRRLAQRLAPVTIEQWERLVEAIQPGPFRPGLGWLQMAQEAGCANGPVGPLVQGRHLEEAGLKPGPAYRVMLDAALEAQLDGVFSTLEEAKVWLAQKFPKRFPSTGRDTGEQLQS